MKNVLIYSSNVLSAQTLKYSIEASKKFVCSIFEDKYTVTREFDVILSEINLPYCNCFDLPTMHTSYKKFIYISELSVQFYLKKILAVGANAIVSKDISLDDLLNILETPCFSNKIVVHDGCRMYELELANQFKINRNFDKINLTKREMEILFFISRGFSSKEISEKLFVSKKTIDLYRSRLLNKFRLKSSAMLIKFAVEKYSSLLNMEKK